MGRESVTIISLTVLSFVAFVVVLVFNGIYAVPNNGLFNQTAENISDEFSIDITPSSYTFSIWAIIYIWQTAWLVYSLVNICRTNSKGPVLLNPVLLPVKFHVFWILSCVFNIAWLFLFDAKLFLASFIALLALTLCGYAAVTFQSFATVENEEWMRREAKPDLICAYVLIQNGTDLLYSWTTVATFLNLAIFATYDPVLANNMSRSAASTMSLSILMVIVIGWSVVENTVFFKFFRYVYAWYGVLIWASAGILVKNYDPSNVNTILTIVILCVAVVCLMIKIGVYVYRTKGQRGTQKPLTSP